MPIIVLYAKAELDGVKTLTYPFPSTQWKFDVQQAAGSETREGVIMDPEEVCELSDTKSGTANFVIKFPCDKKQSHLEFLNPADKQLEKKKIVIRSQTADDTGMVPILAMDCRGLEPTKWYPTGPYEAESESGVTFDAVKLDEGDDWCDYDEKSETSMTIGKDIQYEFKRI